jgi:prepilin-type N-terminal cleavage/methylation domain-containing protein
MKISTRKTGFTLIELVIVIAVIAILAALLIPTIIGQVERARTSRAESDVGELARAIARVRTDTSVSGTGCVDVLTNLTAFTDPSGCELASGPFSGVLTACTAAKPGYPCWGGPYVGVLPTDPWGASYFASLNTTNYTVTVGSFGPDGTASADDDTYVQ